MGTVKINNEKCENNCIDDNCLKRHRQICKHGQFCFYYSNSTCEFNHNIEYSLNNNNLELKSEQQILELNIKMNEMSKQHNELNQIMNTKLEIIKYIEIKEKQYIDNIEANNGELKEIKEKHNRAFQQVLL